MSTSMDRAPFLQAVLLTKISCALGAVITGVLGICDLVSLLEQRGKSKRAVCDLKSPQRRWRIDLLGATLTAFVVFQLDGSLVWYDWTGQETACQNITIPHVLSYVIAKQFLYLFLKLFYLRMLRWGLWLTVVAGVPVCFYWAAFLGFSGQLSIDASPKTCIFYAIYPEVPLAFSVSDFFLAGGMLMIFLVPLIAHHRAMTSLPIRDNQVAADKFKKVIRVNLRYSSLALLSAFVSLNILASFMWIARADNSPATDVYRQVSFLVMSVDIWLGVFLCHLMTSGWMPSCLSRSVGRNKHALVVHDEMHSGKKGSPHEGTPGIKENSPEFHGESNTNDAPLLATHLTSGQVAATLDS